MTDQTARRLLPRRGRQAVLVLHLVCGVGWMGLDIAIFPLLLTALTTSDGTLAASFYTAVGYVVPRTLPFLSLGMTATGLLLSWGTKWGLMRYWWVAVKLVLALVMTALVFFQLVPTINGMPALLPGQDGAAVRAMLGSLPTQLMFPPVVSFLALGLATVFAVVKPWGKTPWAKRLLG